LSSFRILLLLVLFFTINTNLSFSQVDSSNIRIGPDEISAPGGGHFFNYSDKNRVNIMVTVIGGGGGGRFLIPQGTRIFDFLIMAGATGEKTVKDVKIVSFSSDSNRLKGYEVKQVSFANLYGDNKDVLKSFPNPALKPGDMIIFQEPKPEGQPFWFYVREILSYIGTFASFYYLIYNIFNRN